MGRRDGGRFCFREAAAPAGPPQMDSDTRNLRHSAFLLPARDQSLWEWDRGAALWISTLCGPMECSTFFVVNRNLVFQHAEVSAFSRLPADDAWARTHRAGPARQAQSRARDQPNSAGLWARTAVLLCPAPLPA